MSPPRTDPREGILKQIGTAKTHAITRDEADKQYEQVMAFFERREPELLRP
jgi:hypothetical protein